MRMRHSESPQASLVPGDHRTQVAEKPLLLKIAWNGAEKSESRSTIRCHFPLRKPSARYARFRAAWAIQEAIRPQSETRNAHGSMPVNCRIERGR